MFKVDGLRRKLRAVILARGNSEREGATYGGRSKCEEEPRCNSPRAVIWRRSL